MPSHKNSNLIHQMLHGRKRKRSVAPAPPPPFTDTVLPSELKSHNIDSNVPSTPAAAAAAITPAITPAASKDDIKRRKPHPMSRRRKQLAYYKKCVRESPAPTRYPSLPLSGAKQACQLNLTSSRLMQLVWLAKLGHDYQLYQIAQSPIYEVLEAHYQRLVRTQQMQSLQTSQWKTQNQQLRNDYQKENKRKLDLVKNNEKLEQHLQTCKEKYSNLKVKYVRQFKRQQQQAAEATREAPLKEQHQQRRLVLRSITPKEMASGSPHRQPSRTSLPAAATLHDSVESEETMVGGGPSNMPPNKAQAVPEPQTPVAATTNPNPTNHTRSKVAAPTPAKVTATKNPSTGNNKTPSSSSHYHHYHESENLLQETAPPPPPSPKEPPQVYHDSPNDLYEASQVTFHNGRTTQILPVQQQQQVPTFCWPCTTILPPPRSAEESTRRSAADPSILRGNGPDAVMTTTAAAAASTATATTAREERGNAAASIATAADDKDTHTVLHPLPPPVATTSKPATSRRVTLSPNPKNDTSSPAVTNCKARRHPKYYTGYAPNLLRQPSNPAVPDAIPSTTDTTTHAASMDTTSSKPSASSPRRVSTSSNPNHYPTSRREKEAPSAVATRAPKQITRTTITTNPVPGSGWMTNRHNRDFLLEGSGSSSGSKPKRATTSPYTRQSIPGAPSTSNNNTITKYEEVVRKKDEREKLQRHDCPDCGKFMDALMEGDGAKVFERHQLMCTSRHRTRYTPPETPEHFWELSFIDEIRDRERVQQAAGQEAGQGEDEESESNNGTELSPTEVDC